MDCFELMFLMVFGEVVHVGDVVGFVENWFVDDGFHDVFQCH